ncbi:MAG: 2-phosphosulfolactate phosphatase [Cytophagales bacterium]|nr:MAG: 2-phosphosulfolactate phosphatase [Cytophagales bacterium]TAF60366.1 MAG: 2-phosphosulfolactate phosphatase [Cytophagales bacterium]
MRTLDICFTPELLHLYNLEQKAVVIVDILRATSCMVTGLAHGAEYLIPVSSIEACKTLQKQGYVAAAERNGEIVAGFDLGNSPFDYQKFALSGAAIALTTTNGTLAIEKSKAAAEVLIGAFLNISALAEYLKSSVHNEVLIVCAGWKGNFNLEDTLFAGALVTLLTPHFGLASDSALAAQYLFKAAEADMLGFLKQSSHYKRLSRLNIKEDIEFCLKYDVYNNIPVLKEAKLVNISLIKH